jgi:hypothetical protein
MRQTRKKYYKKNYEKNNITKTQKKRIFSNNHYNSGDGMLTAVWGPSMWHFLHVMSFNYPVNPTLKDKKHYRDFIVSLQYILPCKYCRMNLTKNLKTLPITMQSMDSRNTFSRYIYDLHELINKMLNKKSHLSYNDVRERYEHFRSRCTIPFELKKKIIKTLKKKEKGCTEPLYGKKSKCIIKIVPQDNRSNTFQIDKKCIKSR